jgi:hypothetical protein
VVKVDEGFRPTIRAIKKWDPTVRKELRKELRAGGEMIASGARLLASAHSKTTPGTIKVRSRIQSRKAEVEIKAGAADVPIAGLLELGNKGKKANVRKFRHPLPGDKSQWVDQDMHPYLAPAVNLRISAVTKRVGAAVDNANDEVFL